METQEGKDKHEDKLSSLHESVLSIILSKLPTADAVRTSLLSKSWKNMWKTITELHFLDIRRRHHIDFQLIDFVDHVLRDIGSLNINKFHLRSVNYLHDSTLLISWLSKVLKCNLQILDITWYDLDMVNFSPLFARFGSLVELRLHTNCILEIPAPLFLQNLKFFSLKSARIVNKSLISKDLLLKFPVLETFVVSNCFFVNTYTVILDSPFLKIFEILYCHSMKKTDGSRVCKIRVLASKLEKVTFSGDNPEDFLLHFPPSLPYAYLSLGTPQPHWPEKFLESFTCVKSLYLVVKKSYFKISQVVNDFEEIKIPKFRHLIYLNLVYDMTENSKFMTFLNAAPILEKLTLWDITPSHSKTLRTLFSETVPECIQTTLKIVQIRDFQANKIQLEALKYVMENTKNLESVILYTYQTIKEEDKAIILSYPKASPHASVFFEWSI